MSKMPCWILSLDPLINTLIDEKLFFFYLKQNSSIFFPLVKKTCFRHLAAYLVDRKKHLSEPMANADLRQSQSVGAIIDQMFFFSFPNFFLRLSTADRVP